MLITVKTQLILECWSCAAPRTVCDDFERIVSIMGIHCIAWHEQGVRKSAPACEATHVLLTN